MAGSNGAKKNGFKVIGKPFHKVDAKVKCTGELKYADDLVLPQMLHTKLLRSSVPHARIVKIDVSNDALVATRAESTAQIDLDLARRGNRSVDGLSARQSKLFADVEELVIDGCQLLQRSGRGGGQQRHRGCSTDAELLVEHEGAGLVEDQRGGHGAHELHDRRV